MTALDSALDEIRDLSEQIADLIAEATRRDGPANDLVPELLDLTDRRLAAEARFDAALKAAQ